MTPHSSLPSYIHSRSLPLFPSLTVPPLSLLLSSWWLVLLRSSSSQASLPSFSRTLTCKAHALSPCLTHPHTRPFLPSSDRTNNNIIHTHTDSLDTQTDSHTHDHTRSAAPNFSLKTKNDVLLCQGKMKKLEGVVVVVVVKREWPLLLFAQLVAGTLGRVLINVTHCSLLSSLCVSLPPSVDELS